jgi:hypothetical protein
MLAAGYTGGGRVPLPRRGRGARCCRGRRSGGHRACAPARRLCPWRSPALPPGERRGLHPTGRGAAVSRREGWCRAALRARLPGRLGSRRSVPTPQPKRSRCMSMRTSSRRRSRSAYTSTAAARSSSWRAPVPRGADDRRACNACRRGRTRPTRRDRRHDLRLPTTEADLGDGFSPPSAFAREGSRSASARTRMCGSTQFEELRELEGIARRQTGVAACSRPTSCTGRRQRRRAFARSRDVGRGRDRSRPHVPEGRRGGARPGRAACRLRCGCRRAGMTGITEDV